MTAPAHYGPKGKAQKPVDAPKNRRGVTHQERMTNDPRRSPAELDAAILDALGEKPLMKWELRERLHEPETVIYKRLQILKAAKQVKVVGKVLDKRAWALITWQSADPSRRFNARPKAQSKTEAPKAAESWWIVFAAPESSWTAFTAAAQQRDRQAGWSTHRDQTRPSAIGLEAQTVRSESPVRHEIAERP